MSILFKYNRAEFSIIKTYSKHPKFEEFCLHNHSGYEILFVVKGNVIQLVEGNSYHLSAGDMIIVRNDEFHQLLPEDETYERFVIGISKQFFVNNGIDSAVHVFENRKRGEGNLISAPVTKKLGLNSSMKKIERYVRENAPESIVTGAFTEFLYLLSKEKKGSLPQKVADNFILEVIEYISQNFNTIENIDEIADKFYVSKAHLCRKFKKETGFTINRYITNKRLLYVKNSYAEGESLTKASLDAGFLSYAGFYKAYVKETSTPPKKMLD